MEVRAIVSQFRVLATEPANREFMVKDQNCLPALVTFLRVSDMECVMIALETLQYLSLHEPNQAPMREADGLLASVQGWVSREGTDARIKSLASAVTHNLALAEKSDSEAVVVVPARLAGDVSFSGALSESDDDDDESSSDAETSDDEEEDDGPPVLDFSTPVRTSGMSKAVASPLSENKRTPSRYGLASPAKYTPSKTSTSSQSYTIRIDGLAETNRAIIERKLLQLAGVISFTLNCRTERAVLRMSCAPTVVCAAIESIGYHAECEGDEANGFEILNKENKPSYVTDQEHVNSRYTVVDGGDYSLAGRRRARERREKEKANRVNSLLGRVGSWLW